MPPKTSKLAKTFKRKPALVGLLVLAALAGFVLLRRGSGGEEPLDGELGPATQGIDPGAAGGSSDEALSEIQLLADQLALDQQAFQDELATQFGELASGLEDLAGQLFEEDLQEPKPEPEPEPEPEDDSEALPTFPYKGGLGTYLSPAQLAVARGEVDVPQSGRGGGALPPGVTQLAVGPGLLAGVARGSQGVAGVARKKAAKSKKPYYSKGWQPGGPKRRKAAAKKAAAKKRKAPRGRGPAGGGGIRRTPPPVIGPKAPANVKGGGGTRSALAM